MGDERFVEMPIGRQLALLDFTLAAPRAESLRPLTKELYEVYTSADLVASSDYVQRGDHGERIVLKVDAVHGGWSRNDRAVRVISRGFYLWAQRN